MAAAVKRVVITGVSRGLGRAMVEGFVERGHTVYGCARSEETVAQMASQFAPPHRIDVVDIRDDKQVGRWCRRVLQDGGPPDLLINNAGLIHRNAPLWEVSDEEASRVVDVNIKGTINTIRHFVPAMLLRQSGVIVNFSSGWGRSVSAEVAVYCATKWAIEGLSRALAEELPQGMAAVPLNPGVVHTDMLESCMGAAASTYGDPKKWAERAVPFLLELGPQSNGQPLSI